MNELISQLTSQLGISESQAEGGAGALFSFAKENLESDEFSQLSSSVDGVDELVEKAPESEGDGESGGGLLGGLGGMASKLGGGALGSLGGLASLGGMFSKLGIGTDKLGSFVEVVVNFIKEKGGPAAAGILSKVLGK